MLPFSSSTIKTSSGFAMRLIISNRNFDRGPEYSSLRWESSDPNPSPIPPIPICTSRLTSCKWLRPKNPPWEETDKWKIKLPSSQCRGISSESSAKKVNQHQCRNKRCTYKKHKAEGLRTIANNSTNYTSQFQPTWHNKDVVVTNHNGQSVGQKTLKQLFTWSPNGAKAGAASMLHSDWKRSQTREFQ